MARISTNVGAVTAQRNLASSYGSLNGTLERLSTGLRINRGRDDPAGLIVSEQLRREVSAVSQAIRNTQRASNVIATTEGALDEVASLLRGINEKIVEAANRGAFSEDEIRANQLQIDSAVASITRIANTTTFAGRNLLDGSLDYVTSNVAASVDYVRVSGAQFGSRPFIPVNVEVSTSAQPAFLGYPGSAVPSAVTIEVTGEVGATTISFASGTRASQIVDAINAVSDSTGVVASLSGGGASGVRIESELLGSRNFVQIQVLPGGGTFAVQDDAGTVVTRDEGRDAVASINGALTQGDGNLLTLKSSSLEVEVSLDRTFGTGATNFEIVSGGALFQLGPEVNSNLQVGVGVGSVAASRLGNADLGFLSQIVSGEQFALLNGGETEASRIVTESIQQVSILRGRLGAFERNTLETNVNQLGITMENLLSSDSTIRDADFAFETSQLSRNQVLVQSGTSVLGLANQVPQSVLQLLG